LTNTIDMRSGNSKTAGLFKSWKSLCGDSIPTNVVLNQFGFGDFLTQQWPTQLPVLCP